MSNGGHLTWAEIDIGALRHNYRLIDKMAGEAGIMAVVKANGYGHGAVEVSNTFIEEGVPYLAVAFVSEGIELRNAEIDTPILVFGRSTKNQIGLQIDKLLDVTICGIEDVKMVSEAAAGKDVRVHMNVDTGMARLGVPSTEALSTARAIAESDSLIFRGLYSHFASSEREDSTTAVKQIEIFKKLADDLDGEGILPPLRHLANSGGLLNHPDSYFNMMRVGMSVYGYHPDPRRQDSVKFKHVMSLKSEVAQVRRVDAGTPVSYGGLWKAGRETSIATIPIGYTDGIDRALTGKMEVIIRGKKFAVVGLICMDMIMADVGDTGIEAGEEVVIIGIQGNESILASDLAIKQNSISYEITCGIGVRVPRVYINK